MRNKLGCPAGQDYYDLVGSLFQYKSQPVPSVTWAGDHPDRMLTAVKFIASIEFPSSLISQNIINNSLVSPIRVLSFTP